MNDGPDPEAMARAELAEAMAPHPPDLIEGLSPLACMLYLDQLGWGTLNIWTAWLSQLETVDSDAPAEITLAFGGLMMAVGALDGICVVLGLIPAGQAVPDTLPPAVA